MDGPEDKGQWYWLSFADPARPKGTQFLGVVILRGESFGDAFLRSHLLGLNPGGEIVGVEIPADRVPPARYRMRLLSREEAESL